MDCLPKHVCTYDGKCEKLPSCTEQIYDYAHFKEDKRTLGPDYYTDAAGGPDGGKVIDTKDTALAGSAKVSKGCDKVLFVDQDECR